MKKRTLLITTLAFSLSVAAFALIPFSNSLKSFATTPYSCELPGGYVEIDSIIGEAISNGTSRLSSSSYFRGTVTRRNGDYAYVQRVNQTDHKTYAIKVVGLNLYANDISEGNVVDFRNGSVYLDDFGVPIYQLTSEEQYNIAFESNPFGYEPILTQSVIEGYDTRIDNPHYSRSDSSTLAYGYSKLVTIKNVGLDGFYIDYPIGSHTYNFIYGHDLGLSENILAYFTGSYESAQTLFNIAQSQGKTLTITGFFTYGEYGHMFEIVNEEEVSIGDYAIDYDTVNEVSTMNFIYSDYFSFPFAKYYLNGYGDIPYVEFSEFFNYAFIRRLYGQVDPIYKNDTYASDGTFVYYGYNDDTGQSLYEIVVDVIDQSLYVNRDETSGIISSNEHFYKDDAYYEYMADGIESDLCHIDVEHSQHLMDAVKTLYFDFSKYNLDIVKDKNNVVYLPLLALNYIFNESIGFAVMFNGKDLYNANNICDLNGNIYVNTVSQQFENECIWTDGTVSEKYAEHAYNCFCLALEECYGLSYHRHIAEPYNYDVSADALLTDLGYKTSEGLLSTNIADIENAIAQFTGEFFFEGHSGYLYPSVALNSTEKETAEDYYWDTMEAKGNPRMHLYTDSSELSIARNASNREIGINYVKDDTVIIVFDSFVKYYELNDEETKYLPSASADVDLDELDYETLHDMGSDLLFRKAFNEIESNSNIKKVVIDITINGGGMLDSLPFLEAYLTHDPHITTHNKFMSECNEIHYDVDINYDGEFDELDTYEGQYDFYLLTSNYSFSCGNYFPTVLKEMNAATLFGETSGGGACAVSTLSTPIGGLLRNSSNNQLGHWDYYNSEFVINEDGIAPDYAFPRALFYDDNEIYNFVHAH